MLLPLLCSAVVQEVLSAVAEAEHSVAVPAVAEHSAEAEELILAGCNVPMALVPTLAALAAVVGPQR